MDSDEEDFVYVGTPILNEEETSTTRKKKALAEASSQLRTLPSWKQEVRDEDGKRRFHGAFTGGYSAGYYNTVGSKEGWTPQSFSSSRKTRGEIKKQSVLDFWDEDEKAEMEGNLLGTSSQFDTFGFTAAELARKEAEKQQNQRPSAIPGPVPDELIAPASESIGVKLLMKMGWRRGRSIKDSSSHSIKEVRREARKAFLAFSSSVRSGHVAGCEPVADGEDDLIEEPATDAQITPVYVRQPKQDLHGLGYDPYKHAPEFREAKRSRLSGSNDIGFRQPFSSKPELVPAKSRRFAAGFGIGALEELDIEDEDIYSSGHDYTQTYIPEDDEPLKDDRLTIAGPDREVGLKFRAATNAEYQLERFDPPIVPKDFVPRHKFPAPLEINNFSDPPPPEICPPEDNTLKIMIDGVAALVARCGKLFEDISREKNHDNPLFSFLNGGRGHEYYERKLWEERQKHGDKNKWLPGEKSHSVTQKMTAENRGKILGERPLERTTTDSIPSIAPTDVVHIQSNVSDTFVKPEALIELLENTKPFKDDPAKQERFEQFLKDKYQGGLRSTDSGKAGNMSESARARERLDFEAAAEAVQRAKSANQNKLSAQQFMEFSMSKFTSGGVEQMGTTSTEELISSKVQPKRETFQWRPAPLLCKRFDIVDPFLGKPFTAPRARSKLDTLAFTPDAAKTTKSEDLVMSSGKSSMSLKTVEETHFELLDNEPEVLVEIENVERPVDLYKAIFSDDSDDEGEGPATSQMEDPVKKTEAASAALSRIVAGDFLESLGKELGLEVPPDLPPTYDRVGSSAQKVDLKDIRDGDTTLKDVPADSEKRQIKSPESGKINVKSNRDSRVERRDKYDVSSSSGDERSRKRSRKHRRRHSSSNDDSSDDGGRDHSKSRDDKRRSRKKHRRRKHSKHK
ncbi:G patch domain-containing protein TGH [Silene latifolia]|uniref:G patch domain-containing protein TGH n=1 Tax=Silene latifolia TaxID=37657 RepID=UPI003D77594B